MTFLELQQSLWDTLKLVSSTTATPDPVVRARLNRYLNQSYRQVLGRKGIGSKVRRRTMPCTTTANSPFMALPRAAIKLFQLTDRTNDTDLMEISLDELRYRDPGLRSSATNPSAYVSLDNLAAVTQTPTTAGSITIESSNPADTGVGTYVYLELVLNNGDTKITRSQLNGMTPVAVLANVQHVMKFYITSLMNGDITLKDAAGNTMATIPVLSSSHAGERASAYYMLLHLFPVPSAVLTLYADVELHVQDLANDTDEPLLPEDFHDVLLNGALMREYKTREKITMYKVEWNEFNQRIAEMRTFLNRPSGAVFNDNRPRRFSQLGGWFPAGS